ncbi:MAG: beta-N-acetylhexosaminidase [Prevotella sp.]|nr:beta-N-acetylhexosaminidase [Prevotella sp.]
MNRLLTTLMLMLSCFIARGAEKADYAQVIPQPRSVNMQKGAPFLLQSSTVITYTAGNDMQRNATFLSQWINELTGVKLGVQATKGKAKSVISLVIDAKAKDINNTEGYAINITNKGIVVRGKTAAGVFYGCQTLRKTMPALKNADGTAVIEMPAVAITDEPRFGYRGMHLDCSRHFYKASFVKQYIDMIALHNMNRFHWHLTDDQGWRFAVDKYPKLATIASQRNGTMLGHCPNVIDHTPYGGYYTDEEIKDIIKYAADRYITIIPEVDMPGHMMAVLAAYPELGCTGGPYETAMRWGIFEDILCAGNPKSYEFLEAVLDKVCDLFPSRYIHIGGDEAPRTRWEKCPKCQAIIAKEGIVAKDGHSKEALLQGYLTHKVQAYLEAKGRRIIGWDELLGCDVDTTATIMSWRGSEPGAKGAKLGHDVIMTPMPHCYFDFYQTKEIRDEPVAIGNFLDVAKVYAMQPVADGLSPEAAKHIIGVQANVWTEYITCPEYVEYMILPRMAALAEVQWMPESQKNFDAFKKRITSFRSIYDHYGWNVAPHLWK